jgi:uncharacterized caspase-like protein
MGALARCLALLFLSVICALAQAQTGERVALVVGNSAYLQSPLANPRNDAQAMTALLRRAGFVVDQQLDTTQVQLTDAVARFGQAIKDPQVRFGLFYYAGHGLQLEWRNYLVPVSADIRSAEDVRKQTVDVSALLSYMGQAKGRSFLVILDACRDDPFAGSYRPSAKGLSQFDAPVGSLLAYATAPGSVALDGEGQNGLYTGNLLREFSVPGVRVEDAFKRVRLNVRLASHGQQIPWESTSLEDDVYLFPSARRKLSDEEQDRQLEQEIASWVKVKSSRDPEQLADYIRQYPSGSASELAQARLSRLLSAQARQESVQVAAAVVPGAPMLRDSQTQVESARQKAQEAEAQRLAAEREAKAQQEAAAAAQAQRDAQRAEALRRENEQAQAVRLENQRLQEAQAKAAELERERQAALEEARSQELARAQAERLAAAREQALREAQARELAMQQAQAQAAAAAAAEREAERQREAQARAEAERAQQAGIALERLRAQEKEAQAQLAAEQAKASSQLQASAAPAESAALALPPTPYSKGYQEHRRTYHTGDVYNYRVVDVFTQVSRPLSFQVTAVDMDADRVEYNNGEYLSDTMGNIVANPRGGLSTPRQFYPAELFVGKHWRTMFKQSRASGAIYTFQYDLKVVGRETITVPAGTFDTFKIEARGYNMQLGARLERNIWVAPGVSGDIAHETLVRLRNGSVEQNDRQELVSYRVTVSRTAQR